jgi:hypothetical protein
MRKGWFLIVAIIISLRNLAQTDSTAHPIIFGAFVDAYYAYSFNNPSSKNIDYAYNHSRHNEFDVNLALISAKYNTSRLRGNLALQAGTYPQFNYASEPAMLQHIYDANAGVRLCKSLWLDAGIFGSSHIGFESAISKDNWTLTRSMSAENTPYYASGAELNYEPSEKLLVSLLVINGWQVIHDNNSNKAVGYQVTWKPNAKFGFNTSSFFGEGYNAPDSMALMRYFNHAYLYFHPTSKISLALMCDVGLQQRKRNGPFDAMWVNPTFFFRVIASKKWSVCYRAEYYDDSDRVIFTNTPNGVVFKTAGTSLNVDYTGIDNVVLRVEGKYFQSENKVYTTKTGLSNTNTIVTGSIAWWF